MKHFGVALNGEYIPYHKKSLKFILEENTGIFKWNTKLVANKFSKQNEAVAVEPLSWGWKLGILVSATNQ